MKRLFLLLLLLVLAGSAGAAEVAGNTIDLKYSYKAGQALRYRLYVDMTVNSESNVSAGRFSKTPIQVSGIIRQEVQKVAPGGDAEVLYSFESMKIGIRGGEMQNLAPDQMPATTMLVSPSGEVKAIHEAEQLGGALAQIPFLNLENLAQYSGILPAAAVSVGESWTRQIPFPARDGVTASGTFKAEGRLKEMGAKIGSFTTAVLQQKMTGTVSVQMPVRPGTVRPDGARFVDAESGIRAEAENYFSAEAGRVVYTRGTAELRMATGLNAPTPEQSGVVNVILEMSYRLALLD